MLLIGFSEYKGNTGVTEEAIAVQILQDWQLPASQLHGQTYDGTGRKKERSSCKNQQAVS